MEAVVGALFAPRLQIRLAHPPAFESAVHTQFDAADAEPFISLVGTDAPGANFLVQAIGIDRGCQSKKDGRPHCELASTS